MPPVESAEQRVKPESFAEGVVGALLGPNPFVGLTGPDVFRVIQGIGEHAVKQPGVVLEQQAALVRELIGVLAGRSTRAPEPGDRRFQDPTWSENPFYRAWLQSYLACRQSLHALVDALGLPAANTARAHFAVSLLTEAAAPTNFVLGNPAALKKALETGGASLGCGLVNLLRDIATNGAMPAQVDKSAFQVGKNLAVSPGAVVFKNEVLELVQYAPASEEVYERPLLVVPPQINKFYLFDLAPDRSLFEYAVKSGVQVFAISWRNPTPSQREWGLETYVTAILQAMDAASEITGSPDVNMLGACAGGITTMALLAHLAAKGERRINAVSLLVALLDTQAESLVGSFATREALALARLNSSVKGVLPANEIGRAFAWLRPNDLVWNYWVNNYLLGNDPPAFDVLYWNNDSTSLPARLHGEFLDMVATNPFRNPGALSILGTPIDLSNVTCDAYILAGITDHIVPWKACYATTQMLGGQREFVLNGSGHVQSIVSPPTNTKAKFFTGPHCPGNADEWLAGAQAQSGSWWGHWRDWSIARSGPRRPAPKALGSRRHPAGRQAPGTYVLGASTER
jgi:polyhydroxyalkanoate synthase subunit PhaC